MLFPKAYRRGLLSLLRLGLENSLTQGANLTISVRTPKETPIQEANINSIPTRGSCGRHGKKGVLAQIRPSGRPKRLRKLHGGAEAKPLDSEAKDSAAKTSNSPYP